MMRALRGDVALYEEAESNPSLTQEAYTIVGIVAVINVVVGLLYGLFSGDIGAALITAIVSGIMIFVGYLIWSYLTWFIGTRVFNGTADVGELQRTLGYATTPRILEGLLYFIPGLGQCLAIIPMLWAFYLGIVAVRQALDFDTGKAVLTVGAGIVVQLVIGMLLAAIGLGGAMGLGALTGGN
jgi:hypothetical protein